MQIERIYQPDMKCQMHAIMLLLRLRIPREPSRSITTEVSGAVVQHPPHFISRKGAYERSNIEGSLQ
jgi:hypothetical protein